MLSVTDHQPRPSRVRWRIPQLRLTRLCLTQVRFTPHVWSVVDRHPVVVVILVVMVVVVPGVIAVEFAAAVKMTRPARLPNVQLSIDMDMACASFRMLRSESANGCDSCKRVLQDQVTGSPLTKPQARLPRDQFHRGELAFRRLRTCLDPAQHRFCGASAETGCITSDRTQLWPGQRARLDVIEANQPQILTHLDPACANPDSMPSATRSLKPIAASSSGCEHAISSAMLQLMARDGRPWNAIGCRPVSAISSR